jgi:hypothetical protein
LDNNDNQEIDFVNFCKTFRDLKAKRIKIDTSDELINYLSSQD